MSKKNHINLYKRNIWITLLVTAYVTFVVVSLAIGFSLLTWIRAWVSAFMFVLLFNTFFDPMIWGKVVKIQYPNLFHAIIHSFILGNAVPLLLTFLYLENFHEFIPQWGMKIPFAIAAIFLADIVVGRLVRGSWK